MLAAASGITPTVGAQGPQPDPHAGHAMAQVPQASPRAGADPHAMLMPGFDGEVDHEANGFNPTDILTDFDYGTVSTLSDGRTVRDYEVRFTYEFDAEPYGFDIDFDSANDFYAVNTIPFHFDRNPIKIKVGESVRLFLVNKLEFDPINSFHLHGNFFHYYPTGTSLTPSEYTDMISQVQAQRGILEFWYKYPGRYMFHAHKVEFADLGWTGVIALFVLTHGAGLKVEPAAPIEALTFERTVLRPDEFELQVRNTSPQEITISAVKINDAIWRFNAQPGNTIPRLGQAAIRVQYAWVRGQAYVITLFSSNSIAFTTNIPVAAETATPTSPDLRGPCAPSTTTLRD